jgi:hypothetical protein
MRGVFCIVLFAFALTRRPCAGAFPRCRERTPRMQTKPPPKPPKSKAGGLRSRAFSPSIGALLMPARVRRLSSLGAGTPAPLLLHPCPCPLSCYHAIMSNILGGKPPAGVFPLVYIIVDSIVGASGFLILVPPAGLSGRFCGAVSACALPIWRALWRAVGRASRIPPRILSHYIESEPPPISPAPRGRSRPAPLLPCSLSGAHG